MELKGNKVFKGIGGFLDQNAPTIATFGSMLASGLTVFFAYKASKAAGHVIERRDVDIKEIKQDVASGVTDKEDGKAEEKRIKIDAGLQLLYIYKWSIISATISGGLAFLSNHLNGRTIAGLSAMIALNQDKIQKGSEKIKELVGEEKFEKLREDINREVLGDRLMNGEAKIEVADIDSDDDSYKDYERFYDTYWGQFIELPQGALMDAIAEAERRTFLRWNDWRGMLGLESCRGGYFVGWGNRNRFKAHISWMDIGNDGVKTIVYDVEPVGLNQSHNKHQISGEVKT